MTDEHLADLINQLAHCAARVREDLEGGDFDELRRDNDRLLILVEAVDVQLSKVESGDHSVSSAKASLWLMKSSATHVGELALESTPNREALDAAVFFMEDGLRQLQGDGSIGLG